MADRTPGGRPVDERTADLLRRKEELRLQQMRTDLLRRQIGVEQAYVDIEREQEAIAAIEQAIAELEAQLAAPAS